MYYCRHKKNKSFKGVNVENASYGLTNCAERVAVQTAVTSNFDFSNVSYIIVASDCTDSIRPCGACLQVLSEFVSKDTLIITISKAKNGGTIIRKDYRLQELLPCVFNK